MPINDNVANPGRVKVLSTVERQFSIFASKTEVDELKEQVRDLEYYVDQLLSINGLSR